MPDDESQDRHPAFAFYPSLGSQAKEIAGAHASRAGALAFANSWNGPDWARTSDPALIKRML
jgi:hypothetical protein